MKLPVIITDINLDSTGNIKRIEVEHADGRFWWVERDALGKNPNRFNLSEQVTAIVKVSAGGRKTVITKLTKKRTTKKQDIKPIYVSGLISDTPKLGLVSLNSGTIYEFTNKANEMYDTDNRMKIRFNLMKERMKNIRKTNNRRAKREGRIR